MIEAPHGFVMRCAATLLTLLLAACAGRGNAADAGPDVFADRAPDAPPTAVGRACTGDGDCAGLRCTTVVERMCAGPVRPHVWRGEFPGGWCGPATDLATGEIPGGCPSGSVRHTVFVGCDGVPYRYCAPPCARDADCRAAEGYRCQVEGMFCVPPMYATPPDDAGAPDV